MTSRLLIATAALLSLAAGAASAADKPPKPDKTGCFLTRDWNGWRAPDEKTIYLKVNGDIWQVDLSSGSSLLKDPYAHLVTLSHGSDSVCSPIDLDIRVSDGFGPVPVIAKSLTKLTPDQVKLIPKTYLP